MRERKRILIVDDELALAEALALRLTWMNYDPIVASSGAEALTIAVTARPDVILLDLQMPGMDGFAVMEQLRLLPKPHIPVVVLSAHAGPVHRRAALARGASCALSKPCELAQLLAALRTAQEPRPGSEPHASTTAQTAEQTG